MKKKLMLHHKRTTNQQGMVSILVTMIMIIVISLIVLGFATITRHNQREVLDRQLSTQAYYAAETGVNEAVKAWQTGKISTQNTGCTDLFDTTVNPTAPLPNENYLSTDKSVAYTCLLFNPFPASLIQAPLNSGADVVWPLTDKSGNPITSLTFTWANASSLGPSGACGAGLNSYSQASTRTCHYADLRVDLVQASATNLFEGAAPPANAAATLANETATLFMQPSSAGTGTINLAAANFTAGTREATAQCNPTSLTNGTCSVTVHLPANTSSYYARISTIYEGTDSLTVTGTDTAGNIAFTGAQAVVDATGKDQDELRRIQVRTPLTAGNSQAELSTDAVQSTGSICKQLTVAGTAVTTSLYSTGSCSGY
jgi:hypothetical protein